MITLRERITGYAKWLMGGALLLACLGCKMTHTGAMESGVGYSSTTRVFMYHQVDGDKEGREASSKLESALAEKLLLPDPDPDADPVE